MFIPALLWSRSIWIGRTTNPIIPRWLNQAALIEKKRLCSGIHTYLSPYAASRGAWGLLPQFAISHLQGREIWELNSGCWALLRMTLINIQANVFQMLLWFTFPSFLPLLQSSCWLWIFLLLSRTSAVFSLLQMTAIVFLFYPLHCVSFS